MRLICLECEATRRAKSNYGHSNKREWDRRNSIKRKAHSFVWYALTRGLLFRQDCERCGDAKTQAHHEDYAKPLDVNWLCCRCHGARHRAMRMGAASL